METREIKEKLVEIICGALGGIQADREVVACADLMDDFGMDSIMFISIIVEIESGFGITIPDDCLYMEKFRNVDEITELILHLKNDQYC